MSSLRANVLLWAQRVLARKGSAPHVLLEVDETASPQDIQNAFHKIARTSHPDLFRHGLDAAELETVTSAYAVVAGAYQQMRTTCMQTTRIRTIRPDELAGATARAGAAVEPIELLDLELPDGTAPVPRSTPPTGSLPLIRTASATPQRGVRTVQPPSSEPATPTQTSRIATPITPTQTSRISTPVTPSGPSPTGNAAPAMSSKALLYYRKAELCLKRGDLKGAILQLKLACATDPTSSFLRTALAEVEAEVRGKP